MKQNEFKCFFAEEMPENTGCEGEIFPDKISLAIAYVPFQRFDNIYGDGEALGRGTLFKALDLPFAGGKKS